MPDVRSKLVQAGLGRLNLNNTTDNQECNASLSKTDASDAISIIKMHAHAQLAMQQSRHQHHQYGRTCKQLTIQFQGLG